MGPAAGLDILKNRKIFLLPRIKHPVVQLVSY